MVISEAIDTVETFLDDDTRAILDKTLLAAIDRLVDSGIHELGLQMKVEELTAEINRLEQQIEDIKKWG